MGINQNATLTGWDHQSPIAMIDVEPLGNAELKALAEEDNYESYDHILPYSEWDSLEGEDETETWLAAIEEVAAFDDYSLYDGAKETGGLTIGLASKLQADNTKRVTDVSVEDVHAVVELAESVQVPALKKLLEQIARSDDYFKYAEMEIAA